MYIDEDLVLSRIRKKNKFFSYRYNLYKRDRKGYSEIYPEVVNIRLLEGCV